MVMSTKKTVAFEQQELAVLSQVNED
jgi:hypothetical protein